MKYKPPKTHPWNVRTRAQVRAQEKKKKRGKDGTPHLLEQLCDYESSEQEDEVNKQFREFFL